MKKISIIITLFIFFGNLFFQSCKKKDDNINSQTPTTGVSIPKIATSFDSVQNITTTFQYDINGRIISEYTSDSVHLEYSYHNDSVFIKSYNSQNFLYQESKLALNSENLVESGIIFSFSSKQVYPSFEWPPGTFNFNSKATVDTLIVHFKYDNGFLVKQAEYNFSGSYYYLLDTCYYENDNIVFDELHVLPSNKYVTYYTTDFSLKNTIGYQNIGISFFGKQSKNLVIKKITNDTDTINISYIFDSQGRVIKEIHTGSYINTYEFTYTN